MAGDARRAAVPPALVAGCLLLLAVLLYANTVGAQLVYDDKTWLPLLEMVRDPWDFASIWGEKLSGDYRPNETLYRPITTWTLALNWGANEAFGLPGTSPGGYHVVNLLLHAGAGWMVYRFLCVLGLDARIGFALSLLFVAHPLHTESIASIINRAEPLGLLFGLGFLLLHRRGSVVLAGLGFLLALWSKESAIAFLPVAILMDLYLGDGIRRWKSHLAYALVLLLWIAARYPVVRGTEVVVPFVSNPLAQSSELERILTAGRVQFDYLVRFVAPVGLSSDYSFRQIPVVENAADPRFLAFLGLLLGSVAIAWILRRSHPWVAFGVLGYACTFAPASNFVFPIGTIMAERLAYAPSIFLLLLIGFAVQSLPKRSERLAAVSGALVLAVFSWMTVQRNRTWRDEVTFFRAMVISAPESAPAQYGAACGYHAEKRLDEAIEHYRKAVEILPDYRDAWNNLAAAYRDRGDLQNALRTYEHLLGFAPDFAMGWYGFAVVCELLRQPERAQPAYERAIRIDPKFLPPYDNLARIHAAAGRSAEAAVLWKRLLELKPDYEPARRNLERIESGSGS